MHPEIKKNLIDQNYTIICEWLHGCGSDGMQSRCYWTLMKDGREVFNLRCMSELQPIKFDMSGNILIAKELPPCSIYYMENIMMRQQC